MKTRTFGPSPNYPLAEAYKGPDPSRMITIAGPCSIESEGQIREVLRGFKDLPFQPTYVRGGPWSFGTYPPKCTGLRTLDMKMFCSLVKGAGLKPIIECLDIRDLEKIAKHADAIQIGARQMQNYPLLLEAGKLGIDITLKRNVGCTLDEFLGAAEYILTPGCSKVILIERGSATFHNHVRWGVDVSIIAHISKYFDVPILVDASHGTGRRDLVLPVLRAGIAAGASGFLIETHPKPDESWSDSEQAYPLSDLKRVFHDAATIHSLVRFQEAGIV